MTELPTHAISLRPPWPWFMLNFAPEHRKDVENRKWNTKFRGDVWVHASKMRRADYEEALAVAKSVLGFLPFVPCMSEVPQEGICGRFRIVDVVPPRTSQQQAFGPPARRWHFQDQYGFLVEDARPCELVPCKGALSFWRVPDPVLDELRKAGG